MSLDLNTPVIVGVGALTQHVEDPRDALEPLDLMATACARAATDAGRDALLTAVDTIWTPRGFWSYSSPGHLLGQRFGLSKVRSVVAEIGILQSTILGRAAQELSDGESEIAIIVGAEARDREARLRRLGVEGVNTIQTDRDPDEILRPKSEIMSPFEVELGLGSPVIQYAMIDCALRAHEGQSLVDYRSELGVLWEGFNRVATTNSDAWDRTPRSAESIVSPSDSNRMLAFPYTKSVVSQWNVNQSAALILCTLGKARSLGLDERRFIYPLAIVDSEAMLSLSERRDVHRSPGFQLAGKRALSAVNRSIEEIDYLELYSCFPAAVRIQQRELGVAGNRRVTETGGMSFAGGPLNHFVIHAWVKMVERLRSSPGSTGLVTAVSGLLTKQGVTILGGEPAAPFLYDDVTQSARAEQATIRVEPKGEGRARVTAYTVIHDRAGAQSVALICDFDQDRRTLRVVVDSALVRAASEVDFCGREVVIGPGDAIRWT